ncbi:MAG: hypothetical protein CR988_08015 [Treponema sp.]|nr:MAG: hypothetical protein CR988_08015 [Treponema sp.]
MNSPVPAAQILIAILPIVAVVLGTVLVFFVFLWKHNEIMCQIKTGIYRPVHFNIKAFSLLVGILLTSVGLVLSIVFLTIEGTGYVLLGGFIPLSLGIGMLIFFAIINRNEFKTDDKKIIKLKKYDE